MPISDDNFRALSCFASVAREYCTFIDSLREGRPSEFYSKLEKLLPRVELAILPVQKETPQREHRGFEGVGMTHDQWLDVAKVIGCVVSGETSRLAAEHRGTKPDATDLDNATRAEMLWDDLADLHRDLRRGLSLWELKTADTPAKAALEWRFCYEFHWGFHLFRAMLTVHEARYRLYAD